MPPEDFCTTKVFLDDQPLETLHTNICLSNHSFKVSRYESKETFLSKMSDEKLFMHIEGIKMNYSFDYKVWTEPGHEWIN